MMALYDFQSVNKSVHKFCANVLFTKLSDLKEWKIINGMTTFLEFLMQIYNIILDYVYHSFMVLLHYIWSLKAPALIHFNYMQKNDWYIIQNVSFWVHRWRKCIQVCNNMRERVLYSRLWENFSFQVKVLHALYVTCTFGPLYSFQYSQTLMWYKREWWIKKSWKKFGLSSISNLSLKRKKINGPEYFKWAPWGTYRGFRPPLVKESWG